MLGVRERNSAVVRVHTGRQRKRRGREAERKVWRRRGEGHAQSGGGPQDKEAAPHPGKGEGEESTAPRPHRAQKQPRTPKKKKNIHIHIHIHTHADERAWQAARQHASRAVVVLSQAPVARSTHLAEQRPSSCYGQCTFAVTACLSVCCSSALLVSLTLAIAAAIDRKNRRKRTRHAHVQACQHLARPFPPPQIVFFCSIFGLSDTRALQWAGMALRICICVERIIGENEKCYLTKPRGNARGLLCPATRNSARITQ